MSKSRAVPMLVLLVLVGFIGLQRLAISEPTPMPSEPYTAEAGYGPARWSGDSLVISYVQSTWQTFQRLDVQSTEQATHVRVLLTQVDHLSLGEPTYVWHSRTIDVALPGDTALYVGDTLVTQGRPTGV